MKFGRNIQNTQEYSLYASVFMKVLLVSTLLSHKLHTENNVCMFHQLTGSVTRFCHFR